MTIRINRRFFLFGSAATLAAAALPAIIADDAVTPERIYTAQISSPAHGLRRVHSVEFGAVERQEADSVMEIKVLRHPGAGLPLLCVLINARANYLWKALPHEPFLFPDKTLMVVEATGVPSQVTIIGDDADGAFAERYNFRKSIANVERWALTA